MLVHHPITATIAVLCVSATIWACGADERAAASAARDARAFDEFAVVWAGEYYNAGSAGDLPLRSAKYTVTKGSQFHPELASFELVYGDCEVPKGEPSCPLPVWIDVYDPCAAPDLADAARMDTVLIRGVTAIIKFDGGLWIETDDFVASVNASVPSGDAVKDSIRLAESLFGANDKGRHIAKSTNWQPKTDATCQGVAPRAGEMGSGTCCSLTLDPDASVPGTQPGLFTTLGAPVEIDVLLGDAAPSVSAFNFRIVYDDTILMPLPGASGSDGNPDFNEAVLGSGWSCAPPAEPGQPDNDPLTGPGHGVALLSCFTNGQTGSISGPSVIAKMRFTAIAPGNTSLEIREAAAADASFTELGSCEPVALVAMTCSGTFVVVE